MAKLIINFPPVIIKLLGFISNEDSAKNIPYKLAVDEWVFLVVVFTSVVCSGSECVYSALCL